MMGRIGQDLGSLWRISKDMDVRKIFDSRSTCALISSPPTPTQAPQGLMPDASAKNVQLVGSVLERTPGPTSSSFRSPPPKTGFPPVQHRTKSAFARSRDLSKQTTPSDERPSQPPVVTSGHPKPPNLLLSLTSDESKWREDVSQENEKIVASMSPEERELERQAILERFGPGIDTILQRARRNREMRPDEQEETESGWEIERVPGSPGRCPSGA